MKVKCPECGHEFEEKIKIDTYSGDYLYGTPEYFKQRYPNKEIPSYPEIIAGDMITTLRECKCGKLFWTAEFSRNLCGECNK